MTIICPKCHKHIAVSPLLPLGTELMCEHCGVNYTLSTAILEARRMESTAPTVMVHGAFVYVCDDCKAHTTMMLDMGVEEQCNQRLVYGRSQRTHRPTPFVIKCPKCDGLAMHTQTVWFEAPRRLAAGSNVLLWDPSHECARAVYDWHPDDSTTDEATRRRLTSPFTLSGLQAEEGHKDEEHWWSCTVDCPSDEAKMQIGEAIHAQLAGNQDYVDSNIILNVDESCKVRLWVLEGTVLPAISLPYKYLAETVVHTGPLNLSIKGGKRNA